MTEKANSTMSQLKTNDGISEKNHNNTKVGHLSIRFSF